jgi:hypothetical protein
MLGPWMVSIIIVLIAGVSKNRAAMKALLWALPASAAQSAFLIWVVATHGI